MRTDPFAAATVSPATIQGWYKQALDAYGKGDYDTATKMLGQTIEADPQHGASYDMLANICRNLGLLDEQRAFYEQWAAGQPDSAVPHERLAQFYSQQGQPDKAVAEIRKYEQMTDFSKRPDDYAKVANLYRSAGQNADAERILRGWATTSPDSAAPHWALGELYRAAGNGAGAEQEYMNVLALTPGNVDAYARLADYYSANKQYDGAINMQKQAIELRGGDMRQRLRLGDLYQAAGDSPSAINAYQEVINRSAPSSLEYRQAVDKIKRLRIPPPVKT